MTPGKRRDDELFFLKGRGLCLPDGRAALLIYLQYGDRKDRKKSFHKAILRVGTPKSLMEFGSSVGKTNPAERLNTSDLGLDFSKFVFYRDRSMLRIDFGRYVRNRMRKALFLGDFIEYSKGLRKRDGYPERFEGLSLEGDYEKLESGRWYVWTKTDADRGRRRPLRIIQ